MSTFANLSAALPKYIQLHLASCEVGGGGGGGGSFAAEELCQSPRRAQHPQVRQSAAMFPVVKHCNLLWERALLDAGYCYFIFCVCTELFVSAEVDASCYYFYILCVCAESFWVGWRGRCKLLLIVFLCVQSFWVVWRSRYKLLLWLFLCVCAESFWEVWRSWSCWVMCWVPWRKLQMLTIHLLMNIHPRPHQPSFFFFLNYINGCLLCVWGS